MKEIFLKNLPILEINVLLLISVMIGNDVIQSIIIILEFMLIRTILGARHYDNLIQCFFMTMALMTSIFLVLKISFEWAILSTIFAAINLTNINISKFIENVFSDGFMYKRKGETKYDEIDEYILNNPDSQILKEFEMNLKEQEPKAYEIYKIRFYERTKTGEIASLSIIEYQTKVSRRRIVEYLDKILFSFRIFCKKEIELIKK